MADNVNDVIENVRRASTWKRILFMAGFCVVLYVVSVVIWFLTGAQALFSLFTGSDNRNLRMLGSSLTQYVNQILKFITFNSEFQPFPFNPFPDAVAGDAESSSGSADEERAGQTGAEIDPEQETESSQPGRRAAEDDDHEFDDLAFLGREAETVEESEEEAEERGLSSPPQSAEEVDADDVLPEWTEDDERAIESLTQADNGTAVINSNEGEEGTLSDPDLKDVRKSPSGKDSSNFFSSIGQNKEKTDSEATEEGEGAKPTKEGPGSP